MSDLDDELTMPVPNTDDDTSSLVHARGGFRPIFERERSSIRRLVRRAKLSLYADDVPDATRRIVVFRAAKPKANRSRNLLFIPRGMFDARHSLLKRIIRYRRRRDKLIVGRKRIRPHIVFNGTNRNGYNVDGVLSNLPERSAVTVQRRKSPVRSFRQPAPGTAVRLLLNTDPVGFSFRTISGPFPCPYVVRSAVNGSRRIRRTIVIYVPG